MKEDQTKEEERKPTIYGYLRVSSDKQDADNQKTGVVAFAERRGSFIRHR